ncbi:hypothetical protein Efla_006725 [Eimeria flavescens]
MEYLSSGSGSPAAAATLSGTPEAAAADTSEAAAAGDPSAAAAGGGRQTAAGWAQQVLPTSAREVSPRVCLCLCRHVRLLQFVFHQHPRNIAFSLWGHEVQLLWLQGFITRVDDEASLLTLDDGTQTLEVAFDFGHRMQQHPQQQEEEQEQEAGGCRCAAACVCGSKAFCCSKHAALFEAAETAKLCAVFVRPLPVVLQHEALAEFRLEKLSLAPAANPNAEAEWLFHVRTAVYKHPKQQQQQQQQQQEK